MSNSNNNIDWEAYWRREMAAQLARDKNEWFGSNWEAEETAKNDRSNFFCSEKKIQRVLEDIRERDGEFVKGHTSFPGAGYMGGGVGGDDVEEQARFWAELEKAEIRWDRGRSTRRRLSVGPKNEMALGFEGLTASEVAARYPGERVEMGGEFDGDQTIVVAQSAQVPGPEHKEEEEVAEEDEEIAEAREQVDDDGEVEMEDGSSSVEDDEEEDPDFEEVSPRSKRRARK